MTPDEVPNGYYTSISSNGSSFEFPVGHLMRFSCAQGWSVDGPSTIECTKQGWLPSQPVCLSEESQLGRLMGMIFMIIGVILLALSIGVGIYRILLKLLILLNGMNLSASGNAACGDGDRINKVKAVLFFVEATFSPLNQSDEGNFVDKVAIHDGDQFYRLNIHFKHHPEKYEVDLSVSEDDFSQQHDLDSIIKRQKFATGIACLKENERKGFVLAYNKSLDDKIYMIKSNDECHAWIDKYPEHTPRKPVQKVTWLGSMNQCRGYAYYSSEHSGSIVQATVDGSLNNIAYPAPFFELKQWPQAIPDYLIPYHYIDREGFFDIGLWADGSWIYLRASPWNYHSYTGTRDQLIKYHTPCIPYPTVAPPKMLTTTRKKDVKSKPVKRGFARSLQTSTNLKVTSIFIYFLLALDN